LRNEVFLTSLHQAVSRDGATTRAAAAANSWGLFRGPANIRTWDGRRLYYYKTGVGFEDCALDESQLLTRANGSGQCGSFAHLLIGVFAVNGIRSQWVDICTADGLPFLVKRWIRRATSFPGAAAYKWRVQFNDGDFMVPDRELTDPDVGYGDIKNTPDLKGQNTAPPSEKLFGSHFIVKMTDVSPTDPSPRYFYDASYGVTYEGLSESAAATSFEAQAVEGYLRPFPEDAAVPGVWRMRDAAGQGNIRFDTTGVTCR
jgi:hypothetical protein